MGVVDAVQEITILTNNYNAEFGGVAGGQFNQITKSGTNQFHGSGFLYWQHQKLNAASTLPESQLRSGALTAKPHFRDSRFGGTFGGPIVKDKLFFFGAYERDRVSQGASSATYFAPLSMSARGCAQRQRSSTSTTCVKSQNGAGM